MFRREVRIVEEVDAWEECESCAGSGYEPKSPAHPDRIKHGRAISCELCNGSGGRWHEAVGKYNVGLTGKADAHMVGGSYVTKSSKLVRAWECSAEKPFWHVYTRRVSQFKPLECDTAGPWEVKG